MRRHEKLIPLSHDHHHVLKQVRGLRAASKGDDNERAEAAREFVKFHADESIRHFREEEEVFFPLVVDEPDVAEPLAEALEEHQQLHALARQWGSDPETAPGADEMVRIATLLEGHVRREEKVIFPIIERVLAGQA